MSLRMLLTFRVTNSFISRRVKVTLCDKFRLKTCEGPIFIRLLCINVIFII